MEYLDARVESFPGSAHLYKNIYSLAEPLEKAEGGKSIVVCVIGMEYLLRMFLRHG